MTAFPTGTRRPVLSRRRGLIALLGLTAAAVLGGQGSAAALSPAPSYTQDFPDASVITDGGEYWAYGTGAGGKNLQVMHSSDLTGWSTPADPLPTLPSWATSGHTWAPSVVRIGASLLMYYTVRDTASGRQCISLAIARTPAGPFADASGGPFVCQLSLGGSIDPQVFTAADGARYLDWKSEDNALGRPTSLWAQRLSTNGHSLTGSGPHHLLSAAAAWQAGIVEGPSMTSNGTKTSLFYAGNDYATANYALGYASCKGPLGPCSNASVSAPWFATANRPGGPGGPSVFTDLTGTTRIGYNTWSNGTVGYPAGVRGMWVDSLAATSIAAKRWASRRRLAAPAWRVTGSR